MQQNIFESIKLVW